MSTLSWNCQGLRNQRIVQALKKVLRAEDPKFVFLMEMKLHKDIMNRVKHELGYTQGVAISSEGNSGGLALLWKPSTRVEVRKYSRWCIDTLVDYEGNGDVWRLTGFYSHLDTSKSEETLELLESLSLISDLLWLCIGDFNEITKAFKKEGGNLRPLRQMSRFRGVINQRGFSNLGFYGPPFSWFKNQSEDGRLKIRLDRALATTTWRQKFSEIVVQHLSTFASDHSMLALCITGKALLKIKQKIFCFEAMWVKDPRCDAVVN